LENHADAELLGVNAAVEFLDFLPAIAAAQVADSKRPQGVALLDGMSTTTPAS